MTTLLICLILILAVFGAPIFAILGAFAVMGAEALRPGDPIASAFSGLIERVLHLATSDEGKTLATIPLFTVMGYVLAESKTADRLVQFAQAVVGWFPGGLAIVTIFVCAMFTTVTGASGVTIVAVGGLVMPELIKKGYNERFSLGLVTGTGSIGLLFPPALPLIIYGIIYGVTAQASAAGSGDTLTLVDFDLSRFLFAGIVPGLVLVGAVSLYAIYVAIRDKVPREKFVIKNAVSTTIRALPELLIPIVMVACLQYGLQIPEAAAITALYVLILEIAVYRDVKIKQMPHIVREAMRLVGAIFILIVAATALTDYFVNAHVPDRMTEWMVEHIHSKYIFLIALNLMLLAVGCVMDIFSALLVVVPLIAPAATGFGIDPFHLGVIFLLNLEIGYVHPPVGLNLFIAAFRFKKPMVELYWAIIPFIVIMLLTLVVVTYVPALTPIKSRVAEPEKKGPAAGTPGAPTQDAGPIVMKLDDGGVWTSAHCETPDIKNDSLAYADCTSNFKNYAKCDTLAEEIDKLDCRDKAAHGIDPFEIDAGVAGDAAAAAASAPATQPATP